MNIPMTGYGFILLILFTAASALVPGTLSAEYMWIAIAVVFFLLNWLMGKKMKSDPDSMAAWLSLSLFGLITTILIAFHLIAAPTAWLMSLWLIVIGGGIFAEGMANKTRIHLFSGTAMIFGALFVSQFTDQFAPGVLFFGVLGVITGLVMPSITNKK